MSIKTIHEIHKDYVNSGVSLIRESQGLKNKELLQELLTELSQEYVKTVFGTVEKVKISAEEAAERELISSEQLKQKFFQDIAKETNIDVKVKNAKQLVNALFSDNLESPIERDEDVLKPRILGTVENIGTIILPPDMLEIVIGSGRGREQREMPVGFDKIGMVEERLSTKLGRERTTFHRKIGILNDNQMRKVSYYHLYLPEFDKTILLNNQYGEGAFVVQGNFNIREARKSDLKGSKEAVMIKFDYEHPEEFLERLDIELNKKEFQISISDNNQVTTGTDNNKSKIKLTKELVEEYFKGKNLEEMKSLTQRQRLKIDIGGRKLYAVAGLYGIKGDPANNQDLWYDLLEKLYGVNIERNKKIEKPELTKEMVLEYFKNNNLEQMKALTSIQRRKIELGGNGVYAVARLYGIKGNLIGSNQSSWYDFLEKIYGVKIERQVKITLTKEMVLEYFKDKNFEEMKKLTSKQRKTMELGGNGLSAVSTLYGIAGDPNDNQEIWYDFLEKMYGVKIERQAKITLTKSLVEEYFKDKSLDEMMNLTKRQKKELKIGGNGLMLISRLYGIKGDPNNNQDLWYDLLEKIYGVEIKRFSKEIIQEYFKDKNFEEMKKLTQGQRKAIDIGGRKLYAVAGLYGITGNPIADQDLWYDLLEKIYGEKIERS